MRITLNPALLRWARERAGFGPGVLAHKFPQLPAWEQGDSLPTLKQLERFAKAMYVPVGYLFLREPPVESVPIPDFRTMADERIGRPSPGLLDMLYICQQRQEWYRDNARATGETPLPFIGTVRPGDDVVRTAAAIRRALCFDVDKRREIPTWVDALRRFIEQADNLGVLVMVSGVVGSNNRRKLDPEEFRGFALSDTLAPLVFINGADTEAAQIFTLAHELVHIWIGQSALSNAQAAALPEHQVERWCNQVAAELLVPMDILRPEFNRHEELHNEIERLARRFKVSSLVILRRIHDAGEINPTEYRTTYDEILEKLGKLSRGNGGNFYLTLAARASKRFARALIASTLEGRSSYTDAFRLLGFKKMATFHDLAHTLGLERERFILGRAA